MKFYFLCYTINIMAEKDARLERAQDSKEYFFGYPHLKLDINTDYGQKVDFKQEEEQQQNDNVSKDGNKVTVGFDDGGTISCTQNPSTDGNTFSFMSDNMSPEKALEAMVKFLTKTFANEGVDQSQIQTEVKSDDKNQSDHVQKRLMNQGFKGMGKGQGAEMSETAELAMVAV